MVDEILRRRVMMTRAEKRIQLDKLKQAFGQSTLKDLLNNNSSNFSDNFDYSDNNNFDNATRNSSPNCDLDATRNSFSADNFSLHDNYLCDGSPDKMQMEALKELNINDIKDFLNNDTSKPFEKQKRAPPPQYHLEFSRGDDKDQ